jgi:hypothetical protein
MRGPLVIAKGFFINLNYGGKMNKIFEIICDDGVCSECKKYLGKFTEQPEHSPPFHLNCKCKMIEVEEILEEIFEKLEEHEGVEKNAYTDIKGNVTIGYGSMFNSVEEFKKLPLYYQNRLVTPEEKEADFYMVRDRILKRGFLELPKTEMKIDFLYGDDAWDDSNYEETGKVLVNGWISYYDSNLKKSGFKPMVVVVREDDDKKRKALKRKFTCDEEIKQIGLTLSVIEGAEVIELTMDMLDEETREDIECGLLDFEDVKRELGGRAIGDRVSELRFAELTPKKNKPQDTVYSSDDMHPAREDVVEEEVKADDEDVKIDLFADDLDDDDL